MWKGWWDDNMNGKREGPNKSTEVCHIFRNIISENVCSNLCPYPLFI